MQSYYFKTKIIIKIAPSIEVPFLVFLLFNPSLSCAEVHATLTMTTNNVGRWYTKNNNNFALQANAEYQHSSGFFLGNSISNIDYEAKEQREAAQVEVMPYLGWNFKLSDQWRIDTQWSRYLYDGTVFGHQADYNEFYLFLHYQDIFSSRVSFAEDYYGLGNYAIDYEVTGKYPLADNLEFSTSFGYGQTKAVLGSDYPYWNAGFTYFYKFVAVDLRYMDATETSIDQVVVENIHERYDPAILNAAIVFAISMGF